MRKLGLVVEELELEAFTEAGRRLREQDPVRFRRLFALLQAFVALHESELESAEMFAARCAEIAPGTSKPLA